MTSSKEFRIRLLRLEPSEALSTRPGVHRKDSKLSDDDHKDADRVTCTVSWTLLSSAPTYKALSYTWGDANRTQTILLNGKPTSVTSNLEFALRHISATISEPLTLWVDAVCINQQDEAEKCEQVARMRDIYIRAEEVMAWLGSPEDEEREKLALAWISEFGARAKALNIGNTPDMLLRRMLGRAERCPPAAEATPGEHKFLQELKQDLHNDFNPQFDALVAGLQDFLLRPYWKRIWIVQELTVADKVRFMCASGTVDLHTLHFALRLLRNFRMWQLVKGGASTSADGLTRQYYGSKQMILETDPSNAINLLKVRKRRGSDLSMIQLLARLATFEASDPRDRIYALLGLASDAEMFNLKPDYTTPCEQVYTQVARVLLRHNTFEMLNHSFLDPRPTDRTLNLQSWVRDWTTSRACAPLQERSVPMANAPPGPSILHPDFGASGSLCQPVEEAAAICHWEEPFVLAAIIVGRVQHVGEPWKADIAGWLHSLEQLSHMPSSLRSRNEGLSPDIWRTAVADQEVRNHRDKPRLADETLDQLDAAFASMDCASINMQMLVDRGLGNYATQMSSLGKGRRPFVTSCGHLGIGPECLQVGDHIVIILGAGVPYALRQIDASRRFTFLGETYTHGCMDGEETGEGASVDRIELH